MEGDDEDGYLTLQRKWGRLLLSGIYHDVPYQYLRYYQGQT